MNSHLRSRSLLPILLLGVALYGCEDDVGEASTPGSPAILADVGERIGPQPGVDLPTPAVRNPFQGSSEALIEGRRLFAWYNCAGCHGTHAGGGMGPSLRDVTWLYGNTDGDIFNSIAQGRSFGMPAWGGKLPREEIWKMVAYIQSLRTPREPSPPPSNPSYPEAPE